MPFPLPDLTPIRFISIDPSNRKMGLSVLELNPAENTVTVIKSTTYVIDMFLRLDHEDHPMGEVKRRQEILYSIISDELKNHNPYAFVTEDFYLKLRNVTAYRSLCECMLTAKNAVHDHNREMKFLCFKANAIKSFVGVKGDMGDKNLVKEALPKLKGLVIPDYIEFDELDEHSVDSIAIGYTGACLILDKINHLTF